MTNYGHWKDYQLRFDQIAEWIKSDWVPRRPDLVYETAWTTENILSHSVLQKLDRTLAFDGWRFTGFDPVDCPVVHFVNQRHGNGVLDKYTGAYVFHFESDVPDHVADSLDVLGVVAQVNDTCSWEQVALACVPVEYTQVWADFTRECNRLAYEHENEVLVVGGNYRSFVPRVDWDDVILPAALKRDILSDIESFFAKGVAIYTRLNLNPFRKILFAGVPGTGKTMLSMALAKWALGRQYRVIYVSSARRRQGDESGATFDKVQQALDIAARSDCPAMVILEELDAYLHDEEKALILNVLDGSESEMNPHGTLLISTTNYPEAIDERVLKRPGRLDRVFIIPQVQTEADAEAMLRHYLGILWRDEHMALVPSLAGYPGAFIREVAIQALTFVASNDLDTLSLAALQDAFEGLTAQIAARDAFMSSRTEDTSPSQNGKAAVQNIETTA